MKNPTTTADEYRQLYQQAMDAILAWKVALDELRESQRTLSVCDKGRCKRDYNIRYQRMLETFKRANQVTSDPACPACFRVLKLMAETFVMLHNHC